MKREAIACLIFLFGLLHCKKNTDLKIALPSINSFKVTEGFHLSLILCLNKMVS